MRKIMRKSNIKPHQMGIPEFAELCGVSPSTAYRWRSLDMLESIDTGGGTVSRAAARGWIKRNIKPKESK